MIACRRTWMHTSALHTHTRVHTHIHTHRARTHTHAHTPIEGRCGHVEPAEMYHKRLRYPGVRACGEAYMRSQLLRTSCEQGDEGRVSLVVLSFSYYSTPRCVCVCVCVCVCARKRARERNSNIPLRDEPKRPIMCVCVCVNTRAQVHATNLPARQENDTR